MLTALESSNSSSHEIFACTLQQKFVYHSKKNIIQTKSDKPDAKSYLSSDDPKLESVRTFEQLIILVSNKKEALELIRHRMTSGEYIA